MSTFIIITSAIITCCSGLFLNWLVRRNSFNNRFRSEGKPASKLSDKDIKKWKNRGLSGSEAGRSYNNGWTDPNNPLIKNGKISFYSNFQQEDKNINTAKINRNELNTCYQLLNDISQDNSSSLNYSERINQLNYYWLPHFRQKEYLLRFQDEKIWDNIYQNIKEAQSVEQVNKETPNIYSRNWGDYYFAKKQKTRSVLIIFQNDKLNEFLSEEQKKVFNLVMAGNSVFFTGSAGTGKSFLLQRIIQSLKASRSRENVAVTATTGIAAVNIKGVTIHSFSGIGGYGDTVSAEDIVKRILRQKTGKWFENWRSTNILIIDEISMLSGKMFDKLEYIARNVRKNKEFFGGLQIILTGDFFQLPPVKSSKFCFEAETWKYLPNTISLNKIYRQSEPKLIKLLNEIRFGEISDQSWEVLKDLENEPNFPNDGIKPTKLVATNNEKDEINAIELEKIKTKSYFFKAIDWEDKNYRGRLEILVKDCLAPEILELKRGCQVMLIKNLTKEELVGKLVNGSQGIVVDFNYKNKPIVKFTNGMQEVIEEVEWTDETPIYHTVRARRTQIPLVLSWAITIHKSQGQSIERLKVDLSKIFERGQTYVALSRACSLKYLQVVGFSPKRIICDEKVKKFYQDVSCL